MMKETIHYIHTHIRRHLIVVTIVFFVSMWLGVAYAKLFTTDATTIFQALSAEFSGFEDIGPVTMMLVIFFNNALKTLFVVFFGVLLGIIPLVFVVTNGFIIGVLSFFFYTSSQTTTFLVGILPHGIIEIPAFLIGSAIGVHVGVNAFKSFFSKNGEHISSIFMRGLNVFTHILVPLFLLAALIETFITGTLITLSI